MLQGFRTLGIAGLGSSGSEVRVEEHSCEGSLA